MSACCKWREISLNASVHVVLSFSERFYNPITEQGGTRTVNGNYTLTPNWGNPLGQGCKDIECTGVFSASTDQPWVLRGNNRQNQIGNNTWASCINRAGIVGWLPYDQIDDAIQVHDAYDDGYSDDYTLPGRLNWSDRFLRYEQGETVYGNLLPIGAQFAYNWMPYPNPAFPDSAPNIATGVFDDGNRFHKAQMDYPVLYYCNPNPFVTYFDFDKYIGIELMDGATASGDFGSITINMAI